MRPRSLLLGALLAVAPVVAWADPVSFLAAAFSAIGTTVGGVIGATLIMYAVPIAVGVVLAAGISMANRAKRKARDAANAALRDRTVTVRGSAEYRRVVLGRQAVGGVVAFFGSVGQYKEQFVMVGALAGHEIDAVEEVWLNDTKLVLGGNDNEYAINAPYARADRRLESQAFTPNGTAYTLNIPAVGGVLAAYQIETVSALMNTGGGEGGEWVTLNVVSVVGNVVTLDAEPASAFTISYNAVITSSFVRVRTFLGAPGQTVDTVVQGLFPDEWDATHPMAGCAGFAIHFYYSEEAFLTGLPNVMCVCRGAKVYDVRKDSTAGGSGAHRINDEATWEWSQNPALLIAHYALSPLGGQLPAGSVNQARVATAANVCDTQVDYSAWSSLTVAGPDGGVLTDDDDDPIRVTLPITPDRAASV